MGLRRILAKLFGIRLRFDLDRVVPRIDAAEVLDAPPRDVPEDLLLEDKVSVLHPDGSATGSFHVVARIRDPRIHDDGEVRPYATPRREGATPVRKARVLTPDGVWVQARRQRVVTALPDGKPGELTNVVMLGLVPGCVLEIEVQLERYGEGPYGPNVFSEMFMETASPCRRRRFAVALPADRTVQIERYRCPEPAVERAAGAYRVHELESLDARGRLVDPYTPAARDELPTIEVSTLEGWGPVVEGYLRELAPRGAALPPAIPGEEDLPEDPVERARWAYEFVSRHVRYGRPPELRESPAARSAADTARELRGDCKDKVRLLADLLARFGFETFFVLVETVAASRRPFLPSPRFDHTILLAERAGRRLWLEPTPGRVDFDYVPARLQGNPGLVLDRARPRQVTLPVYPLERNEDRGRLRGRIDEAGDLRLEVDSVLTGDYAHEVRDFAAELNVEQQIELLASRLAERFPGVSIEEHRLEDLERLDVPVRERLALRVPRWPREAGRYRIVRLPWRFVASSAQVGQAGRDRGLSMGNRRRETETLELELPRGLRLAGGAVSIEREVPAAAYSLSVAEGEEGRLVGRRVFEVREREVWPADYPALKAFLEEVARDDLRDLVFELLEEAPAP